MKIHHIILVAAVLSSAVGLPPVMAMASESVFAESKTALKPAINTSQAMKHLKKSMSEAMKSASAAEMTEQVNAMQHRAKEAKSFVFRGSKEEQQIYMHGLDKLSAALETVSKLLAAGDVAAAKKALEDIADIKQQYHRKLGV